MFRGVLNIRDSRREVAGSAEQVSVSGILAQQASHKQILKRHLHHQLSRSLQIDFNRRVDIGVAEDTVV